MFAINFSNRVVDEFLQRKEYDVPYSLLHLFEKTVAKNLNSHQLDELKSVVIHQLVRYPDKGVVKNALVLGNTILASSVKMTAISFILADWRAQIPHALAVANLDEIPCCLKDYLENLPKEYKSDYLKDLFSILTEKNFTYIEIANVVQLILRAGEDADDAINWIAFQKISNKLIRNIIYGQAHSELLKENLLHKGTFLSYHIHGQFEALFPNGIVAKFNDAITTAEGIRKDAVARSKADLIQQIGQITVFPKVLLTLVESYHIIPISEIFNYCSKIEDEMKSKT